MWVPHVVPFLSPSLPSLASYLSLLSAPLRIPLTICLSTRMGIRGVAAAAWLSDLAMAAMLASYMVVYELRRPDTSNCGGWQAGQGS